MAVNGVTNNSYSAYPAGVKAKQETDGTKEILSDWEEQKEGLRGGGKNRKAEPAAVYEKSEQEKSEKRTYGKEKTTPEERAQVIAQLKKADEDRQTQLSRLVQSMLTSQGKTYSEASKWSLLSGGDFSADEATVRKAQSDIGEDGYWGVKQTSQRIFDFAAAYAGDDVEKMKTMQKAMEKGFKLAGGAWGKKLPGICYETMDATRAKFDDWFKEHGVESDS